ncbi:MAG: PQ-loop repeat-containing protein [Candidatus Nanoarchaeia archaeon]|nr:PQ-loop repeat-containing protein [Candidatus Nanoarchaeia archaeon]
MDKGSLILLIGMILLFCSLAPQIYRIFKRKSAHDISVIRTFMSFISCVLMVWGSIETKSNLIYVILNSGMGVGWILMIVGKLLYGFPGKTKNKRKGDMLWKRKPK